MNIQAISRAKAKAYGIPRFFTGEKCRRGHLDERYTADGKCVSCVRETNKKKHQKMVDLDPELRRRQIANQQRREAAIRRRAESERKSAVRREASSRRRKAEKNGEATYESSRPCPKGHQTTRYVSSGYCVECAVIDGKAESRKAYEREYYQENRRRISVRSKKYHLRERAERIARTRLWAGRNREKVREYKRAYKLRRRSVEVAGESSAVIGRWVKRQDKVCYWCSKRCADQYHVDHYYPLSRGGEHATSNLVIACPDCNMRKNAKDPYEFAASIGRLF